MPAMDENIYYKPSHRFQPTGPIFMLAGGVLAAAVVGGAYGALVFISPLIYLNILGTFGVGAAVGWVVYVLAKAGHVRWPLLALVIGLLCGFIAEYAAFVTWIYGVSDWTYWALDPFEVWRIAGRISEKGVWSLQHSSTPVSGVVLIAIWVAEAGVIIVAAGSLAYKLLKPLAYCEPCGKWIEDKADGGVYEPVKDPKAMRSRLEAGEFSALGDIKRIAGGAAYTEINLTRCPACDNSHLFSMQNVITTINKKGKSETKKVPIVTNMWIDAESRELILALRNAPAVNVAKPQATLAPRTAPPDITPPSDTP